MKLHYYVTHGSHSITTSGTKTPISEPCKPVYATERHDQEMKQQNPNISLGHLYQARSSSDNS